MVRAISFLVGIGFIGVLLIALIGSISGVITEPVAPTAESVFHEEHPKPLALASDGVTGHYDRRQVQRGFQVYKEVCAACHSLHLVSFRDLEGLGYTGPEVKAIAQQWAIETPSIDPKTGENTTRKNVASDRFPQAPFYAGPGTPPDLSLMSKSRHGGAAYIYSLLTGYEKQPAKLLQQFPDAKTPEGLHYNPYFANLNIAMPPPLTADGQVTYQDGTKPSVDQMTKDVAAFLVWTAEPKLEARHTAGWAALIFILIFCVLTWGAYQNVWRNKEH